MKAVKLYALILAICLCGCTFNESFQEQTSPYTPTTTVQTEPTASAADTSLPTTETALLSTEPITPQPVPVQPEPDDEDFVNVKAYIPDIIVELPYSTDNNFTKQKIYDFSDAWLRYGTVKKLMKVQEELKQSDLYLKVWDGFRPPSAQFKLWDICPDPTYVSNPNKGFSSHSRGNTVDITLVRNDGTEITMPTGFDDFSKLADREYSDCSAEAAANAMLLEDLMKKHGFKPYSGEWWHFSDNQSYPVEESFEPLNGIVCYADCNEFISLRTKPSTSSEVITKILVGEEFLVVARHGDFVLIEYRGLTGYVLEKYISPVSE